MEANKQGVIVYATTLYNSEAIAALMRRTGERAEPVVRLTDYEALQAEFEKLRKDAERYRHLRDRLTEPTFDSLFFLELYSAGAFDHPDDVDEAVDDAMQADNPC